MPNNVPDLEIELYSKATNITLAICPADHTVESFTEALGVWLHEDASLEERWEDMEDDEKEAYDISLDGKDWEVSEWADVPALVDISDPANFGDLIELCEIAESLGDEGSYYLAVCDHLQTVLSESDWREGFNGIYGSERTFAERLAEDLGFERPDSWPYNCIDWDKAAEELEHDYSFIDYGNDYIVWRY